MIIIIIKKKKLANLTLHHYMYAEYIVTKEFARTTMAVICISSSDHIKIQTIQATNIK